MRIRKPPELAEAHFDLTPMVDVVLLLIIFFTLTAQFANTLKTPLELPVEKGHGKPDTSETSVVVDITRTGELRMAAEPITFEALLQALNNDLKVSRAAGKTLDLTVRVDRACPAQHLNALASALTQLGVRNWKLATASEGA
jgi:biopolymer transport protein ExbD